MHLNLLGIKLRWLRRKFNMYSILKFAFLFASFSCASTATFKTKILVLGGGAAGIGFANRLHEKGEKDFVVLEALGSIGGRMRETKFGNLTIQEGAGWIHGIGNDNALYVLKQKFGLAATRDNYTDFIVRDMAGKVVPGAHAAYSNFKKKIEEHYTLSEKMHTNGEDDIPLKTSLELVGWRPKTPLEKTIDFYMNDFENEAPPRVLSAQNVGFTGEGLDEVVTDSRGYAYVLRQLAKSFSNKVHLKTVVKRISYDDKKVTVETANGTKYEAQFAYVTFSSGVLTSKNVEFKPALPDWKMKAAYMLPMGHYTKIFLKFPSKFWDNNRYTLVASEKRGHFVHFHNLDSPGLFPGQKMLIATVTDEESVRVEKLSDAQVKNEVMAVLRQVYANATTATDIFVSRWSLDNTTYGAYSSPVVGTDKYTYDHLRAPVSKTLWFGGEAATDGDNFGYAHGAYAFGVKQADQLMSCMKDGTKCPKYKPRPKPNKICSSASHINISKILTIFIVLLLITSNQRY